MGTKRAADLILDARVRAGTWVCRGCASNQLQMLLNIGWPTIPVSPETENFPQM